MDFLLCHPRPTPKVFRPHNYDEYRVDLYGLPGDAPGDLLAAYVQLGAVFREAGVAWCPIGEVCWNITVCLCAKLLYRFLFHANRLLSVRLSKYAWTT